MKRFKIVFSLVMSTVMILGILQYGLTAKQEPVKAAADITTSNYKTWTASTLAEARDSVNKLLSPIKGSDTSRPYKENRTWQEGSLAALDKVYYASISPASGISSELARQQLIQTVRGLELYDNTKTYSARNLALNDYPNENLDYNLAHVIKDQETGYVSSASAEVIHFTDLAGTMGYPFPGMSTASVLPYVKDSLIQQYNAMKMPIMSGYLGINNYGFYSGHSTGAINTQGKSPNMNGPAGSSTEIMVWFSKSNPTTTNASLISDPAKYVKYATSIFDRTLVNPNINSGWGDGAYAFTTRNSMVRIILYSTHENLTEAQKQSYLDSLEAFENSKEIRKYSDTAPAFIQVSFKRDGATNYDPMVDKIFTPDRIAKGWRHIEVNSSNAGTPETLSKRILDPNVNPTRVVNGVLDYPGVTGTRTFIPSGTALVEKVPWNATLSTNLFNFITGTFAGGMYSFEDSMTPGELKFSGAVSGGMSRFDVTATNNNYTGYKMGDKAPVYNSNRISMTNSVGGSLQQGTYNASPNLYVPLSDAAVELYTYNGTGSESSASSYTLKDTIVSNTYDNYGGTSYSLKSSQLASKKYGTVLSQADLKNAVKDAMGDATYNALNFTNSNALNAASLTVSFDASKNVYKLYAKEAPTQGTITVEHWIKGGAKIATSTQADISKTGAIGALANITPTAISGYAYVDSDSDPLSNVTFGSANKTVKLYYTQNSKISKMTIYYLYTVGAVNIIPPVTIEGPTGTVPTSEQINIGIVGDKYELSLQEPLNPEFGKNTDMVLIYSLKKGKIKVEYWDKDKNQLIPGQTTNESTGEIDSSPNPAITPKTISGYTYDSSSVNLATLKYTVADQTVRLYYTEDVKTSQMKVKYVNSLTSAVIIPEKTIVGTIGVSATDAQLDKKAVGDDYMFIGQTPNSAIFGTNAEVTLYYMPKNKVTIEYWDSDTNSKMSDQSDEVLKGYNGTSVNYTQKEISGYIFDSDKSDAVPSKFTQNDVTVRQYYSKVYTVTIEYWDSGTNSKITTEANTVITGKKDAALSYSPKEIDGYIYDSVRSDKVPTTITGDATYRAYYNKAGSVTIEYWSSDTNQKLSGQQSEVLKGIIGAKAEITPKEISGYKFDASRSDAIDNVTYQAGSNTIRLYYTQYINLTILFEKVSPKEELGRIVEKVKIGDKIHLENDLTKVKAKVVELENSYRLDKRPDNYAAYTVPNADATVTYLFDGTLFLSSAPNLLEFGSNHKIMHLGEYESERPTYDQPLTVTDTRANLTSWEITAKLTTEMHSRKDPSFILTNVLYYRNGSTTTAVSSEGNTPIVKSKHTQMGDLDVSKVEWENKSNGFIFKLSKDQFRQIDDYDGIIQYTLTEAP